MHTSLRAKLSIFFSIVNIVSVMCKDDRGDHPCAMSPSTATLETIRAMQWHAHTSFTIAPWNPTLEDTAPQSQAPFALLCIVLHSVTFHPCSRVVSTRSANLSRLFHVVLAKILAILGHRRQHCHNVRITTGVLETRCNMHLRCFWITIVRIS